MTAAVTQTDASLQDAETAMGGGPQRRSAASSARNLLGNRIGSAIAIVIAVLWTVPTFGLFLSSLRPESDIKRTGWWTFFGNPVLTLENYEQVLGGSTSTNLSLYFMNSLVICIPATLLPLALAIMAAYAFSVLEWRGRDTIFVVVFALQIVPLQMSLIPLLRIFSGTAAADAFPYLAVWVAHAAFAMPLATFLLHNFMSEVPRDLIEAARIDGAGPWRIFHSVILPLAAPGLVAAGLFAFVRGWNDFIFALTLAGPDRQTLPPGLVNTFISEASTSWPALMAASLIVSVPVCIAFILLQRFLVGGITAGAVKG